jgi:hypothetical protein
MNHPNDNTSHDAKPNKSEQLDTTYRFVLLTAGILLFIVFFSQLDRYKKLYSSSQHDVRACIACAHNILAGRDIYKTHHRALPEDKTLTSDIPKFTYPPLLGFVFLPSTLLPYSQFKHIWFFLNIFFVIHGLFLLTRILPWGKLRIPAFAVITSLILVYEPFPWILRCANFDAMTLYLMILSCWFYEKEKFVTSGLLIVFSAWLKVTPALIYLFYLTRGNKRFAIGSVAFSFFLLIVQYAVMRNQFIDFFFEILPERAESRYHVPSMQSLWSLEQLLFVPGKGRGIFNLASHFNVIMKVSLLSMVASLILVFLRTTPTRIERFYGFAICCIASLLVTDSTWLYRYIWMTVPITALLFAVVFARRPLLFLVPVAFCFVLNVQYLHNAIFGKFEGLKLLLKGAPAISAIVSYIFLISILFARGTWHSLIKTGCNRIYIAVKTIPKLQRKME